MPAYNQICVFDSLCGHKTEISVPLDIAIDIYIYTRLCVCVHIFGFLKVKHLRLVVHNQF